MRQVRLAMGLLAALAAGAAAAQTQTPQTPMGPGMMGNGMMGGGMMGGGMMGGGMMGQHGMGAHGMMGSGYGSMPRHRYAMTTGVPAPYASLTDPLPRSTATIARGHTIYTQSCASCHGPGGAGDGEAARNLSPRPANLAWLAQMPLGQWDSYMYWAVAEGGAQFGSAMPAFKDALAKDDIWAVIAFIQARFPRQ